MMILKDMVSFVNKPDFNDECHGLWAA